MKAALPLLLLACISCRTPAPQTDPRAATMTGKAPITVRSSPDGTEVAFGFSFRSTLSSDYRVTPEDCGFVLRTNKEPGITITLPLLPYPCALMFFNEKGTATVNLEGTAADGTGGDFNGEKTFTLGAQEGAVLHVNQNSAFYRGLFTCRGGYGGCTSASSASAPVPAPVSSADLTDFKATEDSNKKLTIAPGYAAIGSHTFPQPVEGSIEFTAGTGDAKIYFSKQGILTTEAAVGTTAKMTGGMILIASATPSFPQGAIPVCDLALTDGTYTVDQCDMASRVRTFALDHGSGIASQVTQGVMTLSVDETVARRDSDNIWTGTNDFTNANIVGTTLSATQKSTAWVAWIALLLAIVALALILLRHKAHA